MRSTIRKIATTGLGIVLFLLFFGFCVLLTVGLLEGLEWVGSLIWDDPRQHKNAQVVFVVLGVLAVVVWEGVRISKRLFPHLWKKESTKKMVHNMIMKLPAGKKYEFYLHDGTLLYSCNREEKKNKYEKKLKSKNVLYFLKTN